MDKRQLPGNAVKPDEDRLVLLGYTSKPKGLTGGVRMIPQFDDLEDFENLKTDRLFLKDGLAAAGLRPRKSEYSEVTISEFQEHQRFIILHFDGVEDMNAAETFRNLEVYVYEDELWDLQPGQYYNFQLIGLEVYDSETDTVVGTVKSMRPGIQNYLNIQSGQKEFLIPYVPQIVTSVDLKAGRITTKLPPGIDDI